jgi:hypothetical protein
LKIKSLIVSISFLALAILSRSQETHFSPKGNPGKWNFNGALGKRQSLARFLETKINEILATNPGISHFIPDYAAVNSFDPDLAQKTLAKK